MELLLFVVVVLFALAFSDLIVGVSNDAVNFLNAAIGSRVSSRNLIMIVAGLGILLGVTFSNGMMEVARKGIFHPQYFVVTELIVVFLAVMLTDIILLDLFSTFGLPTSTTVSIVFELLGAAVSVSVIKIVQMGQNMSELVNYINTAKALAIISGILISIAFAFTFGALVQWIVRLVFTFDFKLRVKRYGAIYGGIAMMTITYFILIKGAKGSSWMSEGMIAWIKHHTLIILAASMVAWTILLQLLHWLLKLDILKFIVLAGTGALAMAFAANDLVNFIGVPLAGFNAYKLALLNAADPLNTTMEAMAGKVHSDTWLLLVAGGVMVVTMWFSKKAKTVIETTVRLGRQAEGEERFKALGITRPIVKMGLSLADAVRKVVPAVIRKGVARRFMPEKSVDSNKKDRPAFDVIRASSILIVSSALISLGTSLKLPLSTTYVTFMVAMGASLADRAWGRESAVYRISGVFTVVGGWFLTAIIAFSVSFIFALLIFYFKLPAILLLIAFAVFMLFQTFKIHRDREVDSGAAEGMEEESDIGVRVAKKSSLFIAKLNNVLDKIFEGLLAKDEKKLRNARDKAHKLKKSSRSLASTIISDLQTDYTAFEMSPRIITSIGSIGRHISDLSDMCYYHIVNQHKPFDAQQENETSSVYESLKGYLERAMAAIDADDRAAISETIVAAAELNEMAGELERQHIKRLKKGGAKTRQSMLYFAILTHSQDIADELVQLLKGYNETFHPGE